MSLGERDLQHLWHPCSQMKDYESFPPLEITGAEGSYLHLADGSRIIDAISSWWCKSLGHGHSRLKKALAEQVERFEHVILANTTNETIVALSEKLAGLCPGLDKVFYAGEGSTAVEIAVKMSLHAQKLRGQGGHNRFIALENGYHGETIMALALGDLGLYKNPYRELLPEVGFLRGLPYVSGPADPVWTDCSAYWPAIEAQLRPRAGDLCAIVVEPVVQGAGGMLIYSPDFLRRLRKWTSENGVYLVADEIMTGFGRTGFSLACRHAAIQPDFLCLSKALTAGWLPMSAVITSDEIYQQFYADYEERVETNEGDKGKGGALYTVGGLGKSFLHSNTYSGNALAAAVALEAWKVYEDENIFAKVRAGQAHLEQCMRAVGEETGWLQRIRCLGAMAAADLKAPPGREKERLGFRVYQESVRQGALLRPLGNTIYWTPPLNIDRRTLEELRDITAKSIRNALGEPPSD